MKSGNFLKMEALMRLRRKSCVGFILLALLCALFAFGAAAEDGKAQISGLAWVDKNTDGVNNGEGALTGVTVSLEAADADGVFHTVADATTGKDGIFLFGSLDAGSYRLKISLPDNYRFTYHGEGSCALPASGGESCTPPFTVSAGETVEMPIGATKANSYVSVIAFEDLNANGGRMTSEPLVQNVQVELQYVFDGVTYPVCSGVTDKNGAVKLDRLSPGTYQLAVVLPENYIFGPIGQKVNAFYNCVPPTENGQGVTSPFVLPAKGSAGLGVGMVKTGSLTGSVWFDANANGQKDEGEGGYAGMEVTLYSAEFGLTRTALTAQDGSYQFTSLQAGAYELSVQLPEDVMFTYGQSLFTSAADSASTTVSVSTDHTATASPIGVMPDTYVTLHAFADDNLNGSPDEGEAPLAGVRFEFLSGDGASLSGTTDETGAVTLRHVRGGSVSVRCVLPDGYVFTLPGGSSQFASATGISECTLDTTVLHGAANVFYAGVTRPAAISGVLFEDSGTAGVYQTGDRMLSGFAVEALNAQGETVARAVTDDQGAYAFNRLIAGVYTVRFGLSDPYIASDYAGEQAGEHVNQIAGGDAAYGVTREISLSPGSSVTVDASVFKAGIVEGKVLLNPAYDQLATNDGGLAGVKVVLLDGDGVPVSDYAADTTDENGAFYIKGILPGTYTLSYSLPENALLVYPQEAFDAAQYTSAAFNVSNGQELQMQPIGAVRIASMRGTVHFPVNGATAELTLTGDNGTGRVYRALTNEEGQYALESILPGVYTLTVQLPEGYMVDADASSTVPASLTPVSSQIIKLEMGATVSEADIFARIPAQLNVIFAWDENASSAYDASAAPVAALQVEVTDKTGAVTALATDENGLLQMSDVLPGRYTLSFVLDEDQIVTSPSDRQGNTWTVAVELTDGQSDRTEVCVLRYAAVDGQVWSMDGSANGVSGLTVQLLREGALVAEAQTDAQGAYHFSGLLPGSYTLSAALPEGFLFARKADTTDRSSYIQEGVSVPFDLTMGQQMARCDIGIGMEGALGDTAWLDLNGNGMQDLDEPGLPGVTIELYQYGQLTASVTTDVYGHYELTGLFPGIYTLQVTMPAEVKTTVRQTEYPLVASILPESDDTTVTVENVVVPSGAKDLNCDLGFALRNADVYPEVMKTVPAVNWTPYSER